MANKAFNSDSWAFTSTKAQYKCRDLAFSGFLFIRNSLNKFAGQKLMGLSPEN